MAQTGNYLELKKGGFIKERSSDRFAVRLRIPVGILTTDQLAKLSEVAHQYSDGFVHITSRQGIEIPGVRFADLEAVKTALAPAGLAPGSCGPRIRNIMACPGAVSCSHAFLNARALGQAIDARFVGKDYSVKVKIAVSGCPNSCTTPQTNDIGFVGTVEPILNPDLCNGDGLCEAVCKEGAISMDDNDLPVLDTEKCINCGDCIAACPTEAWATGRQGYTVYVGGKVGRHPQLGAKFAEFVTDNESLDLIEKILAFLGKYGKSGERLGSVINRTGLEELRRYVNGT